MPNAKSAETTIGIRDQLAWGARSFEEANATHRWQVPAEYNIAADCVHRWAADSDRCDEPALIWERADGDREVLSWKNVDESVRRLADGLKVKLNVQKGDIVAVLLPQRPETAIVHMAIMHLGAITLPISKLFGSSAVAFRLGDANPVVVVVDADSRQTIDEAFGQLSAHPHVVTIDGPAAESEHTLSDLISSGSAQSEPMPTSSEDPAVLIYTSGTTGEPKGCLHAHRSALGHANLGYALEFPQPGEVYYSHADWSWIAGLMNGLVATWGMGLTIVCHDGRFEPGRAADFISANKVSCGFFTPAFLRQMRDYPLPKGHRLRVISAGGELLTPEVWEWALEHFAEHVNVGFGQTEANDFIGAVSLWETPPIGPLGRPKPGCDVAVLDQDGNPLVGVEGEIAMRWKDHPVVMLGYLGNESATKQKMRSGWLWTGDLGVTDERGYISFAGRTDDVIKSSGYRIGPSEIESCLLRHPDVAEAAVIGVPDERRGQAIAAYVVLRSDAASSDELALNLQAQVRERVGKHAYPQTVHFVEDLPKTVTGKLIRAQLRTATGVEEGVRS